MANRKNKLTTVFDGDDRPFQKKVKRVQGAAKKTGALVNKLGGALAAVGVTAGLSQAIQKFDRIGKIANRLNMSAEALQRLGFAAEQSGASMEKLQGIMTRLERRTGEAQQNSTGTQAQRFKELNIELESFAKLNPEQKIMAMADAFNALGGTEKSVASLMGLLDTEIRELIPLLKLGSDGITSLGNEISVLSNQGVKNLESASDGFNKFKNQLLVSSASSINFMTKLLQGADRVAYNMKDSLIRMGRGEKGGDRWGFYDDPMFADQKTFDFMKSKQKQGITIDGVVAAENMMAKEETAAKAKAILNRRKAGRDLLTKQIKTGDVGGLFNRTATGTMFQGFKSMFKKGTGSDFGDGFKSTFREMDLKFRKSGGWENIQDKVREAKAANKSVMLDNNFQVMRMIKKQKEEEMNMPSQTSGKFGQFVAAATLGSGRGRSVSQSRGIRIQGLDKSVLIQEAMKKALESLVENTTEK